MMRYELSKGDTTRLAPRFRRQDLRATLAAVHSFVRKEIAYKLDPEGWQYIKSPSQTISDGYGDCKAYSILIGSLLYNLSIPFSFRFADYGSGDYTHVYIVAGQDALPIDACLSRPFFENAFSKKRDMHTKIAHLSGTTEALFSPGKRTNETSPTHPKTVAELIALAPIDEIPDGMVRMVALREQLTLEKEILKRRGAATSQHDDAIDAVDDALQSIHNPAEIELVANDLEGGLYQVAQNAAIRGIGAPTTEYLRRLARMDRNAYRKARLAKRPGAANVLPAVKLAGPAIAGFFQDVADWIRDAGRAIANGAKAVASVVLAPAKAAARGIMSLMIPNSGPFFLYLFWKAQELSPQALKKRVKAEKVRSIIVDVLGMQHETFMRLALNGIMKNLGKTPKEIMIEMQSGRQISGIGAVEWAVKAFNWLTQIIGKISQIWSKIPPEVKETLSKITIKDAPDSEDWTGEDTGASQDNSGPGEGEIQRDPSTQEAGLGSFALPLLVLGGLAWAMAPKSNQKKRRARR